MRTLIFILAAAMPTILFGQCHPEWYGTLKAQVQDHSVILRNDTTSRECNSLCNMEIRRISDDTLVWMQIEVQAGANCLCNFNLSATVDSLKFGNYIAKVYYSRLFQYDTCYIGSIPFTITEPFSYFSPHLQNQYQSSCFVVGLPPDKILTELALKVFPNPTVGVLNIVTELKGPKGIRISNVENKTIYEIQTDKEENAIDLSHLPNALYFVTVWNNDKSLHAKFLKN